MERKRFNKRIKIKVAALLVALLLAIFCLTSCMGILENMLNFLGEIRGYGDNTGLSQEAVVGTKNPLTVGFQRRVLTAFWDVKAGLTYDLLVSSGGEEKLFENVPNGKINLSEHDYSYVDSLELTLTSYYYDSGMESDVQSEIITFTYNPISTATYNKFTREAGGFSDMDSYAATRYEFFEYFSYLIIFRPDAKLESGKNYLVTNDVYIGYDLTAIYNLPEHSGLTGAQMFDLEIESAVAAFEDSAAYSYSYSIKNNVASLLFKFEYSDPDYTTNSGTKYTNVLATDVHYTLKSKARVFPIDSRENTVTVSSSDQLYFAIKKGYKPDCVENSNASAIYIEMRRILSLIISDADSDAKKVHAIHDYISNTCVYDHVFVESITKNDSNPMFAYTCLYMEGVFGYFEGSFQASKRAAICDGLAKALNCMVMIEGIDAVKVAGTADGVAHAWNKVKIDNKWYLVDATWNNRLVAGSNYEQLRHDYLLTIDLDDHVEDPWFYYPPATSRYTGAM